MSELWTLLRSYQEKDKEVLVKLIEGGADINEKKDDGDTPLLWAIHENNTELFFLLIEKGADIKYAKSKIDSNTPLLDATCTLMILTNDPEVSIMSIEKGADINVKNDDGDTPLLIATRKNNIIVAHLLVDKGVHIPPSLASNPIICDQIRWNRRKALMMVLAGSGYVQSPSRAALLTSDVRAKGDNL